MATVVFNGAQCIFILSDAADLSEWPKVTDDATVFVVGFPFAPIIVTDLTGIPTDATPDMLAYDGQTVTWPGYAPALLAAQVAATKAVEAYYVAYIAQGCPINFSNYGNPNATMPDGTVIVAGAQVLQTRGQEDTTNWLINERICDDLIAAEQGAAEVTLRCASNANVSLAAAQSKAVMAAMRQRGAGILAYSWSLKNKIAQATTLTGVAAILADLSQGWPG